MVGNFHLLKIDDRLQDTLSGEESNWIISNLRYTVMTIVSFLVVIGKSINFVVFCLSSANFRARLLRKLRSKENVKEEKRSQSVSTAYTRCDSKDSRTLSQKKSLQSIWFSQISWSVQRHSSLKTVNMDVWRILEYLNFVHLFCDIIPIDFLISINYE